MIFLATVHTTEESSILETLMAQTNELIGHSLVILEIAGYPCDVYHLFDQLYIINELISLTF